ncbi:HSPB1-associated protein 1 isoform X3 [Hippopotamus amphibius kiboko]|uniref:HSPB1-associated protein 1 isoform X3 n=1 Tax=Hippopotamus amphibius kiboko TaxID=575201 RepID=UPI0025969E98|nr:HSPB1-associated protein 1 isoform X3 [Hippopotamus amphibius kiboko]
MSFFQPLPLRKVLLVRKKEPVVRKEIQALQVQEDLLDCNLGKHVKPFTPQKAKEIVMSLQQPAVFCNMVFDWPAQHWTAKHLSEVLHDKQIRFRMGTRSTDTAPQFETTCSYVEATLEEFLTWNCDQSRISGPFKDYDRSKFWAYADYKYFISLFEDKTDIFQDVIWSDFGFPGRNGQESTLWIGSMGAHTPCHLDTYGCNLVFQVQGRIPYEESSVFSKISVVHPDLKRFPQFRKARRHMVTLSPGQVLFVPRHWWHYVESIDPVTVSINSWIELEEDHQARVEEAITRMLVCALKTAENPHDTRAWLNPTEVEETSHEVNCRYLNGAVSAFFDHYGTSKVVETQALRTNGEDMIKEELNVHRHMEVEQTGSHNLTLGTVKQEAASPFGPDLVPVMPSSQEPPLERGSVFESDGEDFVGKNRKRFGKLHYTKRQRMMCESENAAVEQVASDSTVAPPQTLISTDDLLDCLVNPQVTRIVAQLLLQGRSLRL